MTALGITNQLQARSVSLTTLVRKSTIGEDSDDVP